MFQPGVYVAFLYEALVLWLVNEPALEVYVEGGGVGDVPRQVPHGVGHVDRHVDYLPLDAVLPAAVSQTPDAHEG